MKNTVLRVPGCISFGSMHVRSLSYAGILTYFFSYYEFFFSSFCFVLIYAHYNYLFIKNSSRSNNDFFAISKSSEHLLGFPRLNKPENLGEYQSH